MSTARVGRVARTTNETEIVIALGLDGRAASRSSTGLPFFDHMLSQLGRHGGLRPRWSTRRATSRSTPTTPSRTSASPSARRSPWRSATRRASGGSARTACRSTRRWSTWPSTCPAGPTCVYEVDFPGEKILGDPPFDPQLVEEFWRAFTVAAGITLHITLVRGKNTHHIIEATFKGVARSLRDAVRDRRAKASRAPRARCDVDRRARLRHRQPALGAEGARSTSGPTRGSPTTPV